MLIVNDRTHDILFTNDWNSLKYTHLTIKSEVYNALVNPEDSFRESQFYTQITQNEAHLDFISHKLYFSIFWIYILRWDLKPHNASLHFTIWLHNSIVTWFIILIQPFYLFFTLRWKLTSIVCAVKGLVHPKMKKKPHKWKKKSSFIHPHVVHL